MLLFGLTHNKLVYQKRMRWLPFLALYILQIAASAPRFFRTCATNTDLKTRLLYFLHHLSDVFLFWGVFLTTTRVERAVHLALVFITAAHWFSYENRCVATVALNHWCGYDADAWLDSLLNAAALRERSQYYQFLWLGVAAAEQMRRMM